MIAKDRSRDAGDDACISSRKMFRSASQMCFLICIEMCATIGMRFAQMASM